MPKYLVNHTLPAAFNPENSERPAFVPGDIVTETQLKDAGFADLDRLRRPHAAGFVPAITVAAGTEDYTEPTVVKK